MEKCLDSIGKSCNVVLNMTPTEAARTEANETARFNWTKIATTMEANYTQSYNESVFTAGFNMDESNDNLSNRIFMYFLYGSVAFGCIGNVFAVIVMLSSRVTRKNVHRLLLIALTASDTLYLIATTLGKFGFNEPACYVIAVSEDGAVIWSGMLVLIISVSRYIAVVYPLSSSWMYKYRNVMILIAASFLLCFGCVSGIAISYTYENGTGCSVRQKYHRLYYIFAIVVFIGLSVFAFSLIIFILSVLTIKAIVKPSKKERRAAVFHGSERRRQEERKVTRFLMLVTMSYVVTHVPYGIAWSVYYHMQSLKAVNLMVLKICHGWYICSYSLNVLLYCSGSEQFRRDAKKLLPCTKSEPDDFAYTSSARHSLVSSM